VASKRRPVREPFLPRNITPAPSTTAGYEINAVILSNAVEMAAHSNPNYRVGHNYRADEAAP
jgi:hypothetical protein